MLLQIYALIDLPDIFYSDLTYKTHTCSQLTKLFGSFSLTSSVFTQSFVEPLNLLNKPEDQLALPLPANISWSHFPSQDMFLTHLNCCCYQSLEFSIKPPKKLLIEGRPPFFPQGLLPKVIPPPLTGYPTRRCLEGPLPQIQGFYGMQNQHWLWTSNSKIIWQTKPCFILFSYVFGVFFTNLLKL